MGEDGTYRADPVWRVEEELRGYGRNIVDRTFEFAVRSLELFRYGVKKESDGGREIGRQFLRAATSIGANVEEAQAAESKADFVHKMRVAQKEAREARYWLRLMKEVGLVDSGRIADLYTESDEIPKVVSKIVVNAARQK